MHPKAASVELSAAFTKAKIKQIWQKLSGSVSHGNKKPCPLRGPHGPGHQILEESQALLHGGCRGEGSALVEGRSPFQCWLSLFCPFAT